MREYKIKPVLFLYAVCLLAAIKILHVRKEKINYIYALNGEIGNFFIMITVGKKLLVPVIAVPTLQ